MRFTISTIAVAAIIFASVQAAPHRGGHHGGHGGGRNGTDESENGEDRPGRGRGRFSGTGVSSFPSMTAPAQLPSGTGGLPVPDLSTISFEFPSSVIGEVDFAKSEDDEADDDETESKTSTKTKKTKTKTKTKTSVAADASATSSDSSEESTSTSDAAEPTGGDDEPSSAPSTPTATGGVGAGNGTSTYAPTGGAASTTFPEAAGESTLSEPMVVTGEFDGGMVRFGRGVDCSGQSEGGDSDAVFQIEEGGTLKNVIIGADQSEGVHCMGACTIENVWWEAVCEDALTIKQESGVSYVIGGGAKGASDKVIQHNGGGTVNVQGFYATDFGKLYRSCGNCKTMYERHIIMDGVVADGGSATLVGINTNYGDTATITNSCITNTDPICTEFEGNDSGDEPAEVGSGISASCIYTEADVSSC